MPTIWRRWRRWYASRRSSSAFVRPHVPMLYINTGTTKDSYNRSRNGRLIRDRLNHTVDSLQNATFASCFRRATSSASPSKDPSLRVVRHSSSTRSACRQTPDRSVLDALMASDHSARQPGAIRSMSSRNKRNRYRRHTQRRAVSWHRFEGASEGATEGLAELLQGRQ